MKKLLALVFLSISPVVLGQEEKVKFKGVDFRVYRADPEKVRLGWRDERGENLHSLQGAKTFFEKDGEKVKMITNGGIFEPGCVPSGLYVEKGKVIRPLNLKPGKGNFFLKPNGVFFVSPKPEKAGVVEAGAFQKANPSVQLAVQSGPLLLSDGKIHPAFNEGSKNKLLRNGVGVDDKGRVVFVITADKQYCNLWTFASLFKSLGCKDALFLDGDLSRLVVNPDEKVTGQGFASIFGVVE